MSGQVMSDKVVRSSGDEVMRW